MKQHKKAHPDYQSEVRNVSTGHERIVSQEFVKTVAAILITLLAVGYAMGQHAQKAYVDEMIATGQFGVVYSDVYRN